MRRNAFFGLIAVAAIAAVSCNKEINLENEVSVPGKHYVTFTAGAIETKTAISLEGDAYSATWTAADKANIHIYENSVQGVSEMTLSDANKKATFKSLFEDGATAPFTYSAILAGADWYDLNTKIASIPYAQAPAANNIDGNADILVAKPIQRTTQPGSNEEMHFQFKRIVSINKMTVKGLEVGDQVTKVTISGDKNITADYSFENDALDYSAGLDEIELTYAANNVVGNSGTFDVYFICAPVEDATLAIKVETNNHTYEKTFTKTISFDLETVAEFVANVTCCEPVNGNTEEVSIFKETFDKTSGTGGNDGSWSGNIATSSITPDNEGWTFSNNGGGDKCIKMGTGKASGTAVTPSLGITAQSATITFKAAAWASENATISLTASGPEGVAISTISASNSLPTEEWGTYSATITGANEGTKITFSASQNRFFLDEVEVKEVRTSDPNTVSLVVADNTEINGSETEATIDISSNKAWKVTSTAALLADSPIKIEGTAQTTSFTVNFAEANTSVTEAKVAHLTVVAGAGTYAVTKEITVTQKAVTPYIDLDNKTLTAEASAKSATFTVTGCNFNWDVVSVTVDGASDPSYTATKGENGVVTVTFPSNAANGATTPNKTIVVTVGDSSIQTNTCTITQEGEKYVDPNKRYFIEVVSEPSDWSGQYLIVSGTTAMPGNNVKDQSGIGVEVEVADGMIEATAENKVMSFTVAPGSESGKYTIKGISGYIGRTASSNGIDISSSALDNTLEITDGVQYILSSSTRSLRYNASYFRYYGTKTQGTPISLYKYNGTAAELAIGQLQLGTVSCTNNGQSTSSLTFSWDAVTGSVKYMVSADGGEYADYGTETTYTLSGLEPNTSHSISVKAIGDGVFYTTSEPKTASGTTKDSQEENDKVSFSWTRSGSDDTVTSGYSLSTSGASSKSGYYQDNSGTVSFKITKSDNSALFTTRPSSITLEVTLGAGTNNAAFSNFAYACLIDDNGDEISSTVVSIDGSKTPGSTTGKLFNVSIPLVDSAYGVKVYHTKESGVNMRYFGISLTAE